MTTTILLLTARVDHLQVHPGIGTARIAKRGTVCGHAAPSPAMADIHYGLCGIRDEAGCGRDKNGKSRAHQINIYGSLWFIATSLLDAVHPGWTSAQRRSSGRPLHSYTQSTLYFYTMLISISSTHFLPWLLAAGNTGCSRTPCAQSWRYIWRFSNKGCILIESHHFHKPLYCGIHLCGRREWKIGCEFLREIFVGLRCNRV